MTRGLRLGVDVGGTFTDFAAGDPSTGRIAIGKAPTTPDDPGAAILEGGAEVLERLGASFADLDCLIHATTLVANALIQREGARVALITTAGFEDTLDIGVEKRYELFDLAFRRPPPLVPRRLRFGLSERTDVHGARIRPVDPDQVGAIAAELGRHGIEAVAVCLLHSYRNPAAEQEVDALLARLAPGLPVTLSSKVAPEIREFPRSSTAAANAFVQPPVKRYLARLEDSLRQRGMEGSLFLMMSEGGLCTPEVASAAPIRLVESGPAAGVIAATRVASAAGLRRAMAFDMGGTTAKLCLIVDASPVLTHSTEVARLQRFTRGSGLPLAIPSVELIEIGAGGGSIAGYDAAGLLRVGPRSAGAVPGPACYGRGGTEPTVTDADFVLGRLDAGSFFGGRMRLDRDAAETALRAHVGHRNGLDAQAAATAVSEMVDETMATAARIHAVEHGEDPGAFTLIAFGGAGPLHAWRIASILRMREVIVPAGAGVMSALGLLAAEPAIELSRSHVGAVVSLDLAVVDATLHALEVEARGVLGQAGIAEPGVTVTRSVACRYRGQAYEIGVALPPGKLADLAPGGIEAAFGARYRELYGRTLPGGEVEALTWRVAASRRGGGELHTPAKRAGTGPVLKGTRPCWFAGHGMTQARVLDRYALAAGDAFDGPVLVEEDETTTLAGPGARLTVDGAGNLVMALGSPSRAMRTDGLMQPSTGDPP